MSEQELMTECAKEVAKEVYQDGGKPVVKATGSLLGLVPRAIKAAFLPLEKWIVGREYNLAETEKLLQLKLENISPDQIESPEAHIAVPALQYISYCMDNEELRNMYANLLANSMNSAVKNGVHPSFVEIIKQLCPDEAKIMKYIFAKTHVLTVSVIKKINENTFQDHLRDYSNIGWKIGCEYPLNIGKYFINLIRLGLIERPLVGTRRASDLSLYNDILEDKFIVSIRDAIQRSEKDTEIVYEFSFLTTTQFGRGFCEICIDGEAKK